MKAADVKRLLRIRWTVAKKIGGLALVLLLLLVGVTANTLLKFEAVDAEIEEISTLNMPMAMTVSRIESHLLKQSLSVQKTARLAAAQHDFRSSNDEFETNARVVDTEIHRAVSLAKHAHAFSEATQEEYEHIDVLLDLLQAEHQSLKSSARALVKLLDEGGSKEGLEELIGEAEASAEAVGENIEELLREVQKFTAASVAATEEYESQATHSGVLFALAAVVIGGVLSFITIRSLRDSIAKLTSTASRIAEGDLSGESVEIHTSDELGQLAIVFDVMIHSLREQVSQTNTTVSTLRDATSEILVSARQQTSFTKRQAATVQEITSTMEEISHSGAQMSDKARHIADTTQATTEVTASGLNAIAATNETMESIREQVEEVANNIVMLSEKAQAVGQIIASVNDVAEQSNLLALNAAIEAAGAGEQGSRFSVVASEIKNLADQAKDSTAQVRTILSDVQKGINTAVMLTEEAVKRVESGKEKAEVTESTIRELAGNTKESSQVFQQIIAGTNQQQIGVEQVTQGMKDFRQAAHESANGTAQLENAVGNLNDLGSQLETLVNQYKL